MCRFTDVELDSRFRLILRKELLPQIFNCGNNGCESPQAEIFSHLFIYLLKYFSLLVRLVP